MGDQWRSHNIPHMYTQPLHSPLNSQGGGPGANGATGMIDDQGKTGWIW